MKLIIAGSRTCKDMNILLQALKTFKIELTADDEIVSGTANGADTLGELYARQHNIPVMLFRPDWIVYKTRAGFIRNVLMAKYADKLLALWDGQSTGTSHMIDVMRREKKHTYVFIFKEN